LAHALQRLIDIAALSSLASWVCLAFFRGQFWRIQESLRKDLPSAQSAPDLVALIPARDEASCIGRSVTSLLTQRYAGSIRVIVIDDNSSDDTAAAARSAAGALQADERLQVVVASSPPTGWTGKLWALAEGLRQARAVTTEYLLMTDADIVHDPDSIGELVAKAQSGGFDLVSLMVKLRCESPAERAFIPAFLFFFFMLYPPAWVVRRHRQTAAAAGGCMLVRRQTLDQIGGIASIRGELIDDCALAKRVKEIGGREFLGATARTRSLRAYKKMRDVELMISRTAFTQLHHSTALLIGTLVSMSLVFVLPPLFLFAARPAFWMGAAAWLLMSACYLPALRLYKLSPLRAITLPASALFYLGATIHSAWLYWRGRGGIWKGRVQDSASA
jgi:hopene-associated glycosyltransferase HpnB